MSAREQVAFLVGSEHRVAVMDALHEGPSRPCELERSLSASRATVQRALSGLEERGWVDKRDGAYRLSAGGLFVLRAYRKLTDVVDTVEAVGSPLSLLDGATADMPVDALGTATVTKATAKTPHAPIEHYASLLDRGDVDRFRAICPVMSTVFSEVHRPLVEAGVPVELVVDEQTLSAAESMTPESHAATLENDAFDLYVVADPLDFGVSLFDGTAVVGAYDDRGEFRACLDARDEPFVEWTTRLFEEHRGRARRLETA
jgi:predicted transcriptional regulator